MPKPLAPQSDADTRASTILGGTHALEPGDRIDALDIMRGLALFGVLQVNLLTEFRVSIFQQFLPTAMPGSWLDQMVEMFVHWGLEAKSFTLFSFLFGVGLAVQYERLAASNRPLFWLFRRLVILLLFGLTHLFLIWNGDILTEYALAGLLILPLIAAPQWALGLCSGVAFAVYFSFSFVTLPFNWPEQAWIQSHVAEANRIYASGSLMQIFQFSVQEVKYLLPLHLYVFPRTVALFLFGAFTWRSGVLQRAGNHKGLLLSVAWIGMATGIALVLVEANGMLDSRTLPDPLRLALPSATPILLGAGYAATVVALVAFSPMRKVLHIVAPLGRMAFTNYILQSLFLGFIFFGYGLGQFGHLAATPAFLLGIALYASQAMFSRLWLQRYRFGPLEWLWRTLMYGQAQVLAR